MAGLQIITYPEQAGLVLTTASNPPPIDKKVLINLNGVFQIGTDRYQNNDNSFYMADVSSGNPATWRYPFMVFNTGGATPVNQLAIGASSDQIGFYGSAPVTKPVITGCRSDGTALHDLLQKLQAMGLITDQTTP